jgi:hypothetical protein
VAPLADEHPPESALGLPSRMPRLPARGPAEHRYGSV